VKEFQVGETNFRVNRLKVKVSLAGLKLVGKVLMPALAEAHNAPAGQVGTAVARAVEGLDCLPELLDIFTAKAEYQNPVTGNWMQLAPFVEDVFGGRPDHVVQFLVECVQGEYGSFLDGSGPLAGLLKRMPTPGAPGVSSSPKTT
jgi:hypothetical protein